MANREGDAGLRLLLGVGVTTASLMATEIALTRVLSVTIWYHFAFFAICVALLGTAVGALLVYAFGERLARWSAPALCGSFAMLQGVATLTAGIALVGVTPDWFGGLVGVFTFFTWKLGLVFGLVVVPFVCGGVVLAVAASRHGEHVHRVYFADLLGAAVGCLLVIPLLSWLGGARALSATSAMATLAGIVFWCGAAKARRLRAAFHALGGVLLFVQIACGAGNALQVRTAKGIDLTLVRPQFLAWNSFSMVSVLDAPPAHGWGLSSRYQGPLPEQKSIVIDMNALTPVVRLDGGLSAARYTLHDLSALVYRVLSKPDHVCVIGAGGGKDVLAALAAGSRHVTGVEINPIIVDDIMRGVLREYSGGLYERDDVRIVTGDGRAFLRGARERFDVILISMVDTSAATAAGAYALTENGLYTTQAFAEYVARLTPGGVLTVSTVSLPGLAVGARLASLAREAVLSAGGDPARSVAVARTPWMSRDDAMLYDVLVKPSGFSDAELDAYQAALVDLAFLPVYIPMRTQIAPSGEDGLIVKILRTRDSAALVRSLREQPLDVSPVDDDRPFFFYQNRFADFVSALGAAADMHLLGNGLRVLAKVLMIALAMLAVTLLAPLVWMRARAGRGESRFSDLVYVSCLGVGFMCIEIALIHRVTLYLGQPTYTLVAVLCVLLLAGGLGSRWLAPRLHARPAAGYGLFLGIAVGAVLVGQALELVFTHTAAWSVAARSLVVAGLLSPLGCVLGAALPAGLRFVAGRDPTRIAWLWGVNGAASVVGSIGATLVCLHAGTRASLWLGCALYVVALLLWPRIARADRMTA